MLASDLINNEGDQDEMGMDEVVDEIDDDLEAVIGGSSGEDESEIVLIKERVGKPPTPIKVKKNKRGPPIPIVDPDTIISEIYHPHARAEWVEQKGPACAAATVSSSWNTLLRPYREGAPGHRLHQRAPQGQKQTDDEQANTPHIECVGDDSGRPAYLEQIPALPQLVQEDTLNVYRGILSGHITSIRLQIRTALGLKSLQGLEIALSPGFLCSLMVAPEPEPTKDPSKDQEKIQQKVETVNFLNDPDVKSTPGKNRTKSVKPKKKKKTIRKPRLVIRDVKAMLMEQIRLCELRKCPTHLFSTPTPESTNANDPYDPNDLEQNSCEDCEKLAVRSLPKGLLRIKQLLIIEHDTEYHEKNDRDDHKSGEVQVATVTGIVSEPHSSVIEGQIHINSPRVDKQNHDALEKNNPNPDDPDDRSEAEEISLKSVDKSVKPVKDAQVDDSAPSGPCEISSTAPPSAVERSNSLDNPKNLKHVTKELAVAEKVWGLVYRLAKKNYDLERMTTNGGKKPSTAAAGNWAIKLACTKLGPIHTPPCAHVCRVPANAVSSLSKLTLTEPEPTTNPNVSTEELGACEIPVDLDVRLYAYTFTKKAPGVKKATGKKKKGAKTKSKTNNKFKKGGKNKKSKSNSTTVNKASQGFRAQMLKDRARARQAARLSKRRSSLTLLEAEEKPESSQVRSEEPAQSISLLSTPDSTPTLEHVSAYSAAIVPVNPAEGSVLEKSEQGPNRPGNGDDDEDDKEDPQPMISSSLNEPSPVTEKKVGKKGIGSRVIGYNGAQLTEAYLSLSARDAETSAEEVENQWNLLKNLMNDEDNVFIYHLKNHYAMLFGCRERWQEEEVKDPETTDISSASDLVDRVQVDAHHGLTGGDVEVNNTTPSDTNQKAVAVNSTRRTLVREVLSARKGQRPKEWISFDELRQLCAGSKGVYCVICIKLLNVFRQ